MIRKILKWTFYLIIVLIVFALLPQGFLERLKKFFNWDVFLETLKTWWGQLINFLEKATGIQFNQIPVKLKEKFGIDIILFWTTIKNFLANFFEKLAGIFK
jgi:hypothetical protein